ncbi:bis(5'-nucleosyl)-tetraphosphatase (symmetrical) YqeK [Ignavigranum ruoffiae]|uniref:bis(5'-nucleosyl)-tetraphosphatase (symmetrical) YqeK n=1 Tax=Ignavigranum ruoffiae TaxID=89093 RepID=UPI0024AC95C4|nr:bis(5'-nucleosyl)-tetraphosphatase (symmetrical) YqeK [Ignavigranum ruoffiae]
MIEITYSDKYVTIRRSDLLKKLQTMVSAKRYQHILRVEQQALGMVDQLGLNLDLEKVSIAALFHDYAKDMDDQAMLKYAQSYWPEVDLSGENGNIWHGFAAAEIAREEYGVKDQSILNAIAAHTIGAYQMDTLALLIAVADYIEPQRDFPQVEEARQLAKEDLTATFILKLAESLRRLLKDRQPLFEESVRIYNYWLAKK